MGKRNKMVYCLRIVMVGIALFAAIARAEAAVAPDAAAVLLRARTALGEAWQTYGSVHVRGHVTIDGTTVPYTLDMDLRTGADKTVITTASGPYTYGVDEGGEWEVDTKSGVAVGTKNSAMDGSASRYVNRHGYARENADDAAVTGVTHTDAVDAITITPANSYTIVFSFDSATGRLLSDAYNGGGLTYSDYRDVHGVWFPFKIVDAQGPVFIADEVQFSADAPRANLIARPGAPLAAGEPPPPPADAKEALSRLAQAENDSAFAAFGTLRRRGNTGRGSGSAPTTTFSSVTDLRTGYRRTTSTSATGIASDLGSDASGAWDNSTGVVRYRDDDDARASLITDAYLERRLYAAADAGGAAVTLAGRRKDHGASFDVVHIVPTGGTAVDLWIDASTSTIGRVQSYASTGRAYSPEVRSDYRAVQGVLFPFRSETSVTAMSFVITFVSTYTDTSLDVASPPAYDLMPPPPPPPAVMTPEAAALKAKLVAARAAVTTFRADLASKNFTAVTLIAEGGKRAYDHRMIASFVRDTYIINDTEYVTVPSGWVRTQPEARHPLDLDAIFDPEVAVVPLPDVVSAGTASGAFSAELVNRTTRNTWTCTYDKATYLLQTCANAISVETFSRYNDPAITVVLPAAAAAAR